MRKRSKSKVVFSILIYAALVTSGILIGNFLHISYFKAQKEIDLTAIASIVTTLFAAWYIARIIEEEKEENKVEKELILRRTEDFYQFVLQCRSRIDSLTEVTSNLKRMYVSVKSIYKLLEQVNLGTDLQIKTEIENSIRKLKDLLTNTPISTAANAPIVIINQQITLSQSRIAEVDTEFDLLKDNIVIMELAINRA